jgi:hypothetical protein
MVCAMLKGRKGIEKVVGHGHPEANQAEWSQR